MKNLLFISFLLCSFNNFANSFAIQIPPGTVILDGQGNGREDDPQLDPVDLDEECLGILEIDIYVTNLVQIATNSNDYELPIHATPLYLYYLINQQADLIPVTDFEPYDIHPESGLMIYKSTIHLRLDFSVPCPGGPNIDPEFVDVPYSLALTDQNGAPYPFQDNDDEDEIFSCQVFCDDCLGSILESCMLPQYIEGWTGNIQVLCNSCADRTDIPVEDRKTKGIDPGFAGGNTGTGRSDNNPTIDTEIRKFTSLEEEFPTIQVAPNPFHAEVSISFESAQEAETTVLIFDAAGRQVFFEKSVANKGENKMQIATDQWNTGIYYGQIKSANTLQTFKMVKVK